VLLAIVGVSTQIEAAGPGPETRVRAIATVTVDAVGQRSGETAGGVRCLRPAGPGFVSAPCVATNIESGNYVVSTPAGEYVGQSGNISTRLEQHVASGKFTQAEVDAAERFAVQGTKLDREIAEQLLIDSKGGIDNLLNKVNPIGPKRFGVMPIQPYVR